MGGGTPRRALRAGLLALGALLAAVPVAGAAVRVQRADYVVAGSGTFLSVEAVGDSDAAVLTVAWDAGAGTAAGSGGSTALVPFVDTVPAVDVYLYHRVLVRVTARPSAVRVTSATGDVTTYTVRDWVGAVAPPGAGYLSDFVTSYQDPTAIRDRLDGLAGQFSGLVTVLNTPEQSSGYQRQAMGVLGVSPPYAGATGNLGATDAARAVVLTSVDQGQAGGNTIRARLVDPGTANSPLSVSVVGSDITVNLATDSGGAVSSTAAQVVAAVNANPAASTLVTARTYRGNVGSGPPVPTAPTFLSDYLVAPGSVARGPFQPHLYRVGSVRNGTRVGVLVYAGEHGDARVPSQAVVELVERLLRNYGTDPETTALLDTLEVFVLPSVNPDGTHASFYDDAGQRRTLRNRCAAQPTDPLARLLWGVDLARNFSVGSLFDGYVGGSATCTDDVFAGPSELSEPEARNLAWVASTYPNIKFALGLDANGGYLTWSPGASTPSRVPLPRPTGATEAELVQIAADVVAAHSVLRGSVLLPSRTGARIDVRESAAGNVSDDLYFSRGILAFELHLGPDRFSSSVAGTAQVDVGRQPAFNAEGHDEAMEGASAAYGVLRAARRYALDTTPPDPTIQVSRTVPGGPASVEFAVDEPATVHYTLDGTTPTLASTAWAAGFRQASPALALGTTTTVRWIGVDYKGNVTAVRTEVVAVDTQAPTTVAAVAPPSVGGWYSGPVVTLVATDPPGGSGVAATEWRVDGGPFLPYTAPFAVIGDGARLLEYRSRDVTGNQEQLQSLALQVDSTAPAIDLPTPAEGALVRRDGVLVARYSCRDATSGLASCVAAVPSGAVLDTSVAGTFSFVVTARDAAGNERVERRGYTVSDDLTAPEVRITTPPRRARYARGQRVIVDFACTDAGVGVATCAGSDPDGSRLDTRTAGVRTLSVTATDRVGNARTVERDWVVVGTLPRARLTPRRVRGVLTAGLKVDVRAAFPTRVRITGTLRASSGGAGVALRPVTVPVAAGRTGTFVLRVPPAGAAALRAAGAGPMVATLRVRQQAGTLTRTDTFRLPVTG